MTAVFISYRRSDSKHFTGRMYDRLRAELGRENVFKDVDSIPPGSDFPTILAERLGRCKVALVIVGKEWTTAAESDGTRRLDNPNDFVRLEVETVLGRGIPVIPVLVDGASNLSSRDLPKSLESLCRRHTVEVGDDPRFDADMARLTKALQDLLAEKVEPVAEPSMAEPTREPLSAGALRQTAPSAEAMIGRDRSWPDLARQVANGARRLVLVGPPGVGKTSTAIAFARWNSPKTAPVRIDCRAEFYELSLVEAVGRIHPKELYRDHEGVPFATLPFGTQRRLTIDLLARDRVPVILDGVGEAEYPRDANSENDFARRYATELAENDVLTILTTDHAAAWTDWNPIPIQGLPEASARELLRRELAHRTKPISAEDFDASRGGPTAVDELVRRGNPGEIIRIAGSSAGRDDAPTALARLGASLKQFAGAVLGDPERPPPRAVGQRAAGPGPLYLFSTVLLLVAGIALIWSYESGSALWERMFYELMRHEAEVGPLQPTATKISPGPGILIEMARAGMVIIFFFLVVIGRFFAEELYSLVPLAPWKTLGPRTLGLRSAFRIVFITIAAWMGYSTVVHHLTIGPRTLWMCNGNPFLQEHLNKNDPAKIRELQSLPADSPNKMNAEPPTAGAEDYDRYWRECQLPYLRYYPYSFVMFVLVGPTVLTVCFYAVCSTLWSHLTLQPRTIEKLDDRTPLTEVENRFRYYKSTYSSNVDKYLILLLILFACWAYHLWLDSYNLTNSANDHTTRIILVALIAWAALFAALMLAYQVLVREAGKRFPDGPSRDEFERRHGWFRFFTRTVTGSAYSWLCFVPIAAGIAWHVAGALGGWH